MLIAMLGVAMVVASIVGILYFKPREGRVAPLLTVPFMETTISLAITSGLALGMASILAGLLFR